MNITLTGTRAAIAEATALTAEPFVAALRRHQSDAELEQIQRYFKSDEGDYGEGDSFLGGADRPARGTRKPPP